MSYANRSPAFNNFGENRYSPGYYEHSQPQINQNNDHPLPNSHAKDPQPIYNDPNVIHNEVKTPVA